VRPSVSSRIAHIYFYLEKLNGGCPPAYTHTYQYLLKLDSRSTTTEIEITTFTFRSITNELTHW